MAQADIENVTTIYNWLLLLLIMVLNEHALLIAIAVVSHPLSCYPFFFLLLLSFSFFVSYSLSFLFPTLFFLRIQRQGWPSIAIRLSKREYQMMGYYKTISLGILLAKACLVCH